MNLAVKKTNIENDLNKKSLTTPVLKFKQFFKKNLSKRCVRSAKNKFG